MKPDHTATQPAVADPRATIEGRCYCGSSRIVVADSFEYSLICHCRDCQRVTGSAFKPFAGIKTSDLRVIAGDNLQRIGDDLTHNVFCGACGSQLYALVRDGAYVHVPLGVLDQPPTLEPAAHIFMRSNPAWHAVGDDLPQFEEFPE